MPIRTRKLVTTRAQQATFFVLRQADAAVGSVAYCSPGRSVDPVPASWASVLLLAVDPKHRGKGYGCLLASECMKLAEHDQAATVGLFTSELMGSARRLYEGLGFGVERELPPRHGLRYWLYRYDVQSEEDERVRRAASARVQLYLLKQEGSGATGTPAVSRAVCGGTTVRENTSQLKSNSCHFSGSNLPPFLRACL